MSDREGVSPGGGPPDRTTADAAAAPHSDRPQPGALPSGTPEAARAPGDAAGTAEAGTPEAARAPGDAAGTAEAGTSIPSAAADGESVSAPAEPTLRADPTIRDFEVPFDTGQLRMLPTSQLLVVHRPGVERAASDAVEQDTQRRVYSWVAAVIGVIGAAASLFVGWMLPLSIAAIVFGVLGLRREEEGRLLAFVGIGAGIAGLVFSAVWIGYYAIVFGALPR
jgi:hypothetical protein